jgi:hypothetical protein
LLEPLTHSLQYTISGRARPFGGVISVPAGYRSCHPQEGPDAGTLPLPCKRSTSHTVRHPPGHLGAEATATATAAAILWHMRLRYLQSSHSQDSKIRPVCSAQVVQELAEDGLRLPAPASARAGAASAVDGAPAPDWQPLKLSRSPSPARKPAPHLNPPLFLAERSGATVLVSARLAVGAPPEPFWPE